MLTAPIFINGGYSAVKDPAGKAAMAESTLDALREYVPGLPDRKSTRLNSSHSH